MKTSIGICCYNEQANIGKLLDRLTKETCLDEIVVVCSGCTDATIPIVKSFNHSKIKLIEQAEREGKFTVGFVFFRRVDHYIGVIQEAFFDPRGGIEIGQPILRLQIYSLQKIQSPVNGDDYRSGIFISEVFFDQPEIILVIGTVQKDICFFNLLFTHS